VKGGNGRQGHGILSLDRGESLINFILVPEQSGFEKRSWIIEKSKGYNIKQKE
jgi:hypothetical protein